MFGISVFPGMEVGIEENLNYIGRAGRRGGRFIFTSLHIPEADTERVEGEFLQILNKGREAGMAVVADISKGYYGRYSWDEMKDFVLRLDFGFSPEEIAGISRERRIQLNASTVDEEFFMKLKNMGGDLENITVCHNYYPRRETGISLDLLRERNNFFKGLGITTMGFVCGSRIRRGPLHEGLPTVEEHRDCHILVAAQELLLEGCDVVIVGDSMASEEELKALEKITAQKEKGYIIPVRTHPGIEGMESLFYMKHTERMDPAEYVVRSSFSRSELGRLKIGNIEVHNTVERPRGSITIDNELYGRYQGEVQITKRDLPADERVNVLGLTADDGRLVSRIKPGEEFIFYKTEEVS